MEWLSEVSNETETQHPMSLEHCPLGFGTEAMADAYGTVSLKARINWPENQRVQIR